MSATQELGNGTVKWERDLAAVLGYDVSPTVKCILPIHPFTFVGDEVIVREVVTYEDGRPVYEGGFPYREVRHRIPGNFDRSSVVGVSA